MADQTYTPSFKAAGTANDSSNQTTVAPTYPSGGSAPVAGDIAIAVITKDSDTTISAPDGTWAEITTVAYSTTYRVSAFWKRMAGGEEGTVTFTFGAAGGTNNHGNGQIYLFQDCQLSGTPYEGVSSNSGSSAAQTISSVTYTAGPRLLVIADGFGDNIAGSPPAAGGYSEWWDAGTTLSAGSDGNQHIWGKTLGTSGGTDSPGNCTHGSTANPWGEIGFALKGHINIDVTAAAPTLTGQSVGQDKVFSYTSASLSTTGATLIIERVADIAELSVQGQTVALDLEQGSIDFAVVAAALSTSGSTLTSDESSAVTEADLESTGQTITFILGKNFDVTEAALSTAGQDIVGDEACVFTSAALSTQGIAIVGDEAILVTPASISTDGSTVTFNLGINCPVVEASLSAIGQTVGQDGVLNFTQADLSSAGSDVTLNQGLSFNLVEAALSTQGQALDLDRAYNLGVTEASLASSGQDLTLYPSYSLDVVEASISVVGQTLALDLGGHKQLAVDPVTDLISGSTLSYGLGLDVTEASVFLSGSSVIGDETASVECASISTTGQTVALDKVSAVNTDFPFDAVSLSPSGTSLTIERISNIASLSIEGQDIDIFKATGINIIVDSASLSYSGTGLTIQRPATKASLSVVGSGLVIQRMATPVSITIETSWIDLLNSMGEPTYTLDMSPAEFSITGQWVQIEQAREFNEALYTVEGCTITWGSGVVSTETTLVLTGSDIGFILYNSTSIDVTPAIPVITTQDVTFSTTQIPIPDLQVEQADLTVQGVNVTLDGPPLNVVAASIEVTGRDVGLTPVGIGNVLPVTAASLAINAQDVAQVIEGSFEINVTTVNLTLSGSSIGLSKAATLGNQGKIDGFTEWVLNTDKGYAILYPKDGGYYVISS